MAKKSGIRSSKDFARMQNIIDKVAAIDALKNSPRTSPEDIRGDGNEQRAFRIIEDFVERERFPLNPDRITHISKHFSSQDMKGYDIIVPTDRGDVGVQIKSSMQEMLKFMKKKPHVPCVVVNDHKPDERLYIELSAAILHEYSRLP